MFSPGNTFDQLQINAVEKGWGLACLPATILRLICSPYF
jgi:hypothetical protein